MAGTVHDFEDLRVHGGFQLQALQCSALSTFITTHTMKKELKEQCSKVSIIDLKRFASYLTTLGSMNDRTANVLKDSPKGDKVELKGTDSLLEDQYSSVVPGSYARTETHGPTVENPNANPHANHDNWSGSEKYWESYSSNKRQKYNMPKEASSIGKKQPAQSLDVQKSWPAAGVNGAGLLRDPNRRDSYQSQHDYTKSPSWNKNQGWVADAKYDSSDRKYDKRHSAKVDAHSESVQTESPYNGSQWSKPSSSTQDWQAGGNTWSKWR